MSWLMKMSLCQMSATKNTFCLSEIDPRPLNLRPLSLSPPSHHLSPFVRPPDLLTPPPESSHDSLSAQSESDRTGNTRLKYADVEISFVFCASNGVCRG